MESRRMTTRSSRRASAVPVSPVEHASKAKDVQGARKATVKRSSRKVLADKTNATRMAKSVPAKSAKKAPAVAAPIKADDEVASPGLNLQTFEMQPATPVVVRGEDLLRSVVHSNLTIIHNPNGPVSQSPQVETPQFGIPAARSSAREIIYEREIVAVDSEFTTPPKQGEVLDARPPVEATAEKEMSLCSFMHSNLTIIDTTDGPVSQSSEAETPHFGVPAAPSPAQDIIHEREEVAVDLEVSTTPQQGEVVDARPPVEATPEKEMSLCSLMHSNLTIIDTTDGPVSQSSEAETPHFGVPAAPSPAQDIIHEREEVAVDLEVSTTPQQGEVVDARPPVEATPEKEMSLCSLMHSNLTIIDTTDGPVSQSPGTETPHFGVPAAPSPAQDITHEREEVAVDLEVSTTPQQGEVVDARPPVEATPEKEMSSCSLVHSNLTIIDTTDGPVSQSPGTETPHFGFPAAPSPAQGITHEREEVAVDLEVSTTPQQGEVVDARPPVEATPEKEMSSCSLMHSNLTIIDTTDGPVSQSSEAETPHFGFPAAPSPAQGITHEREEVAVDLEVSTTPQQEEVVDSRPPVEASPEREIRSVSERLSSAWVGCNVAELPEIGEDDDSDCSVLVNVSSPGMHLMASPAPVNFIHTTTPRSADFKWQRRDQLPLKVKEQEESETFSYYGGDEEYEDCDEFHGSDDYDGEVIDCEEICQAISRMGVVDAGLPEHKGRHIRFNYNSDDEMDVEEVDVMR